VLTTLEAAPAWLAGRGIRQWEPGEVTLEQVSPVEVGVGERGVLTVDDFFAPVPEWVLDAAVSDCAVRLFAVLLRYGQTSGARMRSLATLAPRLRKASTDTVDRAMRERVALGAVTVEAPDRTAGR